MFVKYAIGQITVIQQSGKDNETGNDLETTGWGVSYQINDDMAVSYGAQDAELDNLTVDQEIYSFCILHNGITKYWCVIPQCR